MGYESTLIFGTYIEPDAAKRETDYFKMYGTFFDIVGTLDLSKMGYDGHFAKLLADSQANTAHLGLYYRSVDKAEFDDRHGDTFKVLDRHALLEALREDSKEGYRRALTGVATVLGWCEYWNLYDFGISRAAILHYGH